MLIGEYDHRLDGKNRLSIPRKFREFIQGTEERYGFYVTRVLDNCLFLFTESQWREVKTELRSKSFTGSAARRFQRMFFAPADFCEIDKQGRILLTEKLKEHAGLEKEVTVVGVETRVEVWSRELWLANEEEDLAKYEDLAEQLFAGDKA